MNKALLALIVLLAVAVGFFGTEFIKDKVQSEKQVEYLPKGAVVAYEMYRGIRIPILADGEGGQVRWVADVPWDRFTIDEKIDMVRTSASRLGKNDIGEIIFKYGSDDCRKMLEIKE